MQAGADSATRDPREPDRSPTPRIVEVAVSDILDHQRDLVVREHEVAVLPGHQPRRHRGQLITAHPPGARLAGTGPEWVGVTLRVAVGERTLEVRTRGVVVVTTARREQRANKQLPHGPSVTPSSQRDGENLSVGPGE